MTQPSQSDDRFTSRVPDPLVHQVRRAFTLGVIATALLLVPRLLEVEPPGLRTAALACLALLIAWWAWGGFRGRLPLAALAPETAALFVVGSAVTPGDMLLLLYWGIAFRALFVGSRGAVVSGLTFVAVFVGLGMSRFGPTYFLGPEALMFLGGFAPPAVIMTVLSSVLAARDETGRRDRILRKFGGLLVAADSRRAIERDTLAALVEMAGGRADARANVLVGTRDHMRIAAASGDRAEVARGAEFDPNRLPLEIRAAATSGRAVCLEGADRPEIASVLGFATKRFAYWAWLVVQGEITGALVVSSDSPLSRLFRDGIPLLAEEVALALELRAKSEELQRSEERFRTLVQQSSDLVLELDGGRVIRFASPASGPLLGVAPERLVGLRLDDLLAAGTVHSEDRERVLAFATDAAARAGQPPLVCRVRHCGGTWRHLEVAAGELEDGRGVVLNARDISRRTALYERLRHQAFHDPLTELGNRALFRDRAELALSRARRDGTPVAVVLLDVDNMKAVNDSHGHLAGDRFLQEVAVRLRWSVREVDTVARIGGDEFGLVLEGLGEDGVREVLGRMRETMRTPLVCEGHALPLEFSAGVAVSRTGSEELDDLLRRADAELYAEKEVHHREAGGWRRSPRVRLARRLRSRSRRAASGANDPPPPSPLAAGGRT